MSDCRQDVGPVELTDQHVHTAPLAVTLCEECESVAADTIVLLDLPNNGMSVTVAACCSDCAAELAAELRASLPSGRTNES